MREIKFRAWRPSINDMVYSCGNVVTINDIGISFCDADGEHLIGNATHVMQYTGVQDKSGKEIYEGDIVKTGGNLKPLPIIFEDGAFQIENLGYYLNKPLISQWMIEVIGNIYEHPELLK